MDPAQFGGFKGNSITHNLILYYHFIVSNLENSSKEIQLKWIDDIVTAETISLKKCLIEGPEIIGPKNKREQSGLILPPENSRVQTKINELETFTNQNLMSLNFRKTKIQ